MNTKREKANGNTINFARSNTIKINNKKLFRPKPKSRASALLSPSG